MEMPNAEGKAVVHEALMDHAEMIECKLAELVLLVGNRDPCRVIRQGDSR